VNELKKMFWNCHFDLEIKTTTDLAWKKSDSQPWPTPPVIVIAASSLFCFAYTTDK